MRLNTIVAVPKNRSLARRIAVLVFLLIFAGVIAVLLISSIVGWRLVHPERKPLPVFSSNIVPEYKDVSFKDINNKIELKGWFFQTKDSKTTIILSHGYGQNRLQMGIKTLDIVKAFISKGYSVLLFDYRACGVSGGDMTSIGIYEKDDLLGAIKFIKASGSKNIILLGYSMGASTSIIAGSISPDASAVIADSPFSDLDEYINKNLPVWSGLPSFPFNKTVLMSVKVMCGLNLPDSSPRKSLAGLYGRPLMLIHSKDDHSIPVSNSQELYRIYSGIAPGKVDFWETEKAAHVGSYEMYSAEYMDRVFAFINKYIKK